MISDSTAIASYGVEWHIPSDSVINCYGNACYNINDFYRDSITDTTDLFFNINGCGECNSIGSCIYEFRIYCDNGWDYYSSSDLCDSYTNCGCQDLFDNNTQFINQPRDLNCYTPVTYYTCQPGTECEFVCNADNDCSNDIINGTSATFLTINCTEGSYCSETEINCPINGCNITCYGSSCLYAEINYNYSEITQTLGMNGDVTINCIGDSSCYYTRIHAEYAENVNIACINKYGTSYHEICEQTTLYAQFANTVYLYFDSWYASDYSNWYVTNVSFVRVFAAGQYALYYGSLHAEFAESVVITLTDDYAYAAYQTSWYLPWNTTFKCYGDGCTSLGNLYLTTNASLMTINAYGCGYCSDFGSCVSTMYLYCNPYSDGLSYSYSDYCYTSYSYSTDDNCGCYDLYSNGMNYYYLDNAEEEPLCYIEPTPQPTTGELYDLSCSSGEDCKINDCGSGSGCSSKYIDASITSYLTLNCDGSYDCQYTTVVCPNGGCNINCKGWYSCSYMNVFYNGIIEDAGSIQIDCTDYYSCSNIKINADYISDITINCKTDQDSYDYTCYYLELNANYAKNVKLVGHFEYAFYYATIYVNNATNVDLSARGEYGFYYSNLHAIYAKKVTIKCVSGDSSWGSSFYSACSDSNYYLPSNEGRTTINCYGTGCQDMGNIYTIDTAEDIIMNINACGECDDIGDCLDDLTFYCGGYPLYTTTEYYYGYSNCDYDCGCSQFINSISFKDKNADENCFNPGLTGGEIAGIVIGVVVGLCLIIALCYLFFKYDKKKAEQRAANRKAVAASSGINTFSGRKPLGAIAPNYGQHVAAKSPQIVGASAITPAQSVRPLPTVQYDVNGQAYIMTAQGKQLVTIAKFVPNSGFTVTPNQGQLGQDVPGPIPMAVAPGSGEINYSRVPQSTDQGPDQVELQPFHNPSAPVHPPVYDASAPLQAIEPQPAMMPVQSVSEIDDASAPPPPGWQPPQSEEIAPPPAYTYGAGGEGAPTAGHRYE